MELKVKDMAYDQALYIAKEIVKWQKFIGILKVETSCEVIEILLNEIDTLNKGIDELLKKYEEEKKQVIENINNIKNEYFQYHRNSAYLEVYEEIIQDLKKLKGE